MLIIVSVALGFVLAEWREYSAERALAANVLRNVVTEVEGNLLYVEQQIPKLASILERASALDLSNPSDSGYTVVFGQLGGDFLPRPLSKAAWETAVTSGALRLMDYDVAASLSEIYVAQDEIYSQTMQQAVSILYVPETFDPDKRREVATMLISFMQEVEGRVRFLRDLYTEQLPKLQQAD